MKALLLAGVAIGCAASPALAQTDAAAAFGRREQVRQVSISPNGQSLAILKPNGDRGAALYIVDLDAGVMPKPILAADGDPEQLTDCHWSTDTRLVCSSYIIANDGRDLLSFRRLVAIDSDGEHFKRLSEGTTFRSLGVVQNGGEVIDWLADEQGGSLLIQQNYVSERSIGTLLSSSRDGLGVAKVDTLSANRRMVEQPNGAASDYITDGHGTVRIRAIVPEASGGYDSNTVHYYYRKPDDEDWLPLGGIAGKDGTSTDFFPAAVDRDLNVAYGFASLDGRTALYKIALDGTLKSELVYSRPDVDVDGLIRIGRQRRVVGVTYATDKRYSEFFDPQLKALRHGLAKALPDAPLVTFVDASADENTLVLYAGSDVDPGKYYVFDKRKRQLSPLMAVRPALVDVTLANVRPIAFPAADGTQIPGYLTLPPKSAGKNLPAIVLPHGGPGARDEWGFDWLAQFFANRGYAVLQPNFRGSTGYGEDWFEQNGFQSWRTAIGDVDDGGRWLVEQGIADPQKLAILGWSYGGYAALQSGVLDPGLFKAIVAIAPVTDLEALKNEALHFSNYRIVADFIGDGPHIEAGSPARNADKIVAPVLMFHGDRDQNVGVGESELMRDRLQDAGKQVELIEFEGLDHQLDDSRARTRMLEKADAFLRASMGI